MTSSPVPQIPPAPGLQTAPDSADGLTLIPPHLLAVAIGGAIGALARHQVNHVVGQWFPDHAYRATLLVNALGSLAMGLLVGWLLARPAALPPQFQAGLTIGLIGAFTTYSTFATDSIKLLHDGRVGEAIGYFAVMTVVCFGLAACGYFGASAIFGKPMA